MEATGRLIDILQDSARYEDFLIVLLRYIRDDGKKPDFISLNDHALVDVMSDIVDEVEKLKQRAGQKNTTT